MALPALVACDGQSTIEDIGSGGASGPGNSAGGVAGAASGGASTAGASNGGSASGGMPASGGAPLDCSSAVPPNSPLALLTRVQYDNTVADLLGDSSNPSKVFPPENQVEGFKNNAVANLASPLSVEKYLAAAETLSATARGRINDFAPCASGQDQAECGRTFVRTFGLKAFRRPLTDSEQKVFNDLFETVRARSGYETAFELTLQALLQSPQFLYRADSLAGPTEQTGAVALGPYELASRLSYFLTGSMPDSTLFTAAAENRLVSDADVEREARRLLTTPRAHGVVREFHHQWFMMDALPSVLRAFPTSFGSDTAWVAKDWLESFDRFIDHVYWESGSVSELFTSKRVYVNSRLARLYGVTGGGDDFVSAELPDRAGVITQPALMALLAHTDQTAPVQRGVFMLERLMCSAVPPPPPTVKAVPPDPDPNATTRERFDVHTKDPACNGCHRLIDGVGFGFEAYDQLGRYRTTENGLAIDASGEVLISDAELAGSFTGAQELAARLAASSRARDCVATNWYRFALGRLEGEGDRCSLDDVKHRFADSKGDFRELLVAITRSVAFRYRPAIPSDGGP
ncbi:MAG TPA: DUF1592 domain-containing protein [Polyangiaceae bacterium]|nr:DUF1592 domain-containing protein [Polyangiaceae bacterium]